MVELNANPEPWDGPISIGAADVIDEDAPTRVTTAPTPATAQPHPTDLPDRGGSAASAKSRIVPRAGGPEREKRKQAAEAAAQQTAARLFAPPPDRQLAEEPIPEPAEVTS